MGLIEYDKILLVKILNAIEEAPLSKGRIGAVVGEYAYAVLIRLKAQHMIDFVVEDTSPSDLPPDENKIPSFLGQESYAVIIEFRKQDNAVYIKTTDGKEIAYHPIEIGRGRPIWDL